jgi:hypothetical protein
MDIAWGAGLEWGGAREMAEGGEIMGVGRTSLGRSGRALFGSVSSGAVMAGDFGRRECREYVIRGNRMHADFPFVIRNEQTSRRLGEA